MNIETHTVGGRTLRLLPRSSWSPRAALGPAMRLPALGVTIHHSVTTATDDPAADMLTIERIGIQRFGRFSYCYAVHPSGIVGVGAGLTVGAHTAGHNSTRIGVVFIGDLTRTPPTAAALDAAAVLIAWHQQAGRLVPGYNVNGHRAYKSTACPGIADPVIGGIATSARQLASSTPTPTPTPKDIDPVTTQQIIDAIERGKPFAVRFTEAADGRPAGQVWIIHPGGRYPVGRATLNALYWCGAIQQDPDRQPPEVKAADLADVPVNGLKG